MRIFNRFGNALKEYLSDYLKADREEWLARISVVVAFVVLVLLLSLFWKDLSLIFFADLPKIVSQLIRYMIAILVFAVVFNVTFYILKFIFLNSKN